jgi:hypothetical protein
LLLRYSVLAHEIFEGLLVSVCLHVSPRASQPGIANFKYFMCPENDDRASFFRQAYAGWSIGKM